LRATRLVLPARFVDEVLSSARRVLVPAFRARFGLTYAEVSLLSLTSGYASAVAEPTSGLISDLVQRRWLLVWGALGVGLATVLMGAAPTFGVLLLGYALYGAAAGPLAQTADVVLVESHPTAPGRVVARISAMATAGALLGPLLVSAAVWAGLDARWLLVALGLCCIPYALMLAVTAFPAPAHRGASPALGVVRALRDNVRAVLSDGDTLRWLLFLRLMYVTETVAAFESVWLVDVAGMSQALLGVYAAFEMACALCGALVLDRWLRVASARRVLVLSLVAMLVLFPTWFLVPGVWPRFVFGAPLAFAWSILWPVARAESLHAAPRPGALNAANSLTGLLPVVLVIGVLAERVGLTAALLAVRWGGTALLLLFAWRWLPRGAHEVRGERYPHLE
jgi:FSR family fosmidomycin resistance protein-like MFS transporter